MPKRHVIFELNVKWLNTTNYGDSLSILTFIMVAQKNTSKHSTSATCDIHITQSPFLLDDHTIIMIIFTLSPINAVYLPAVILWVVQACFVP